MKHSLKTMIIAATLLQVIISMTGCTETSKTADTVLVYTYKVVKTYPHDPYAFTQGLVFDRGILYESTGLLGQSSLRRVALETGNVLQLHKLPPHLFGEGITLCGNKIIQLTWKSKVGFVYDKGSFELLHRFTYPSAGWGITYDGKNLIMSDGTSTLYFLDPETFKRTGRIDVRDKNGPVKHLNELEYIQGEIYANIWQTERIARISPQTGKVIGWIELKGLLNPNDYSRPVDVLNGIAYDSEYKRIFITGKLWPKLFEIELML